MPAKPHELPALPQRNQPDNPDRPRRVHGTGTIPVDQRFHQLIQVARADLDAMEAIWDHVREQNRREHGPTLDKKTPGPHDRRTLREGLDALTKLNHARQALCSRLPAVDAAVRHKVLVDKRMVDYLCAACDMPTVKIVRGMCPVCYKAWLRAGKPDVSTFVHRRVDNRKVP